MWAAQRNRGRGEIPAAPVSLRRDQALAPNALEHLRDQIPQRASMPFVRLNVELVQNVPESRYQT